jgi:hypothetical protein
MLTQKSDDRKIIDRQGLPVGADFWFSFGEATEIS